MAASLTWSSRFAGARPPSGGAVGVALSAENEKQLYVPPGSAQRFCVSEEASEIEYQCTDFRLPEDEGGVAWNDPAIGITWPVGNPLLSDKDRAFASLSRAHADLPEYAGATR